MKKLSRFSLLIVMAALAVALALSLAPSAEAQIYNCPYYCDKTGNCQWIGGIQGGLQSCSGPMTDCHDGTMGPCRPHCHGTECMFPEAAGNKAKGKGNGNGKGKSTAALDDATRTAEALMQLPDISDRMAGVMSPENWEAFQAEVDAAVAGLDAHAAVQRTAEMYVDKARQLHFYSEQRE